MGKKVRLSESALRNIIMENVMKALKESRRDVFGGGTRDYRGTGTPESKDGVKKIREKREKFGPGFNSPMEKKLDEAVDRAIRKTMKEMRGDWFSNPVNAASYDRWRTAAPGDDSPSMVTEEDFMDWISNPGRSEISDLMTWLADYDPGIYQKVKTGGGENPFMEALDNGVSWKDIASEVFDVTPVSSYPGDREPD